MEANFYFLALMTWQ